MDQLQQFFPFILLIIIFYFLLIRPQMNQQKKRKELLASLQEGNKIRTIGGVYGVIEKIKDDELTVKISENTKVRMARFGIESIIREKE